MDSCMGHSKTEITNLYSDFIVVGNNYNNVSVFCLPLQKAPKKFWDGANLVGTTDNITFYEYNIFYFDNDTAYQWKLINETLSPDNIGDAINKFIETKEL